MFRFLNLIIQCSSVVPQQTNLSKILGAQLICHFWKKPCVAFLEKLGFILKCQLPTTTQVDFSRDYLLTDPNASGRVLWYVWSCTRAYHWIGWVICCYFPKKRIIKKLALLLKLIQSGPRRLVILGIQWCQWHSHDRVFVILHWSLINS